MVVGKDDLSSLILAFAFQQICIDNKKSPISIRNKNVYRHANCILEYKLFHYKSRLIMFSLCLEDFYKIKYIAF